MTLLDQPQQQTRTERAQAHETKAPVNVGSSERAVSVAAGSILALLGLRRASIPGLLIAGVGGSLIYRGTTGHCSMYSAMGIDTAHGQESPDQIAKNGIHVEQA